MGRKPREPAVDKKKKAPRDKGDGGLYEVTDKRTGLTYWRGVVEFPRKPDGKRDRRTATGHTKDEAKAGIVELKKALARVERGEEAHPERIAAADLWQEWLEAIKPPKTRLKPRSWESYAAHVRLYLAPEFGSMPIVQITPAKLEALFGRLRQQGAKTYKDGHTQGLSERTIHRIHTTAHVALEWAWRKKRILSDNPADYVTLYPVEKFKPVTLTEEQVYRLIEAIVTDPYEALWLSTAATGRRLGEMLGEQWRYVDLDNLEVHVVKKLRTVGTPELETPKSMAGHRVIPIPQEVADAYRRHLIRQQAQRAAAGPQWQGNQAARGIPEDTVFTTSTGNWLNAANVTNRYLKRMLIKAGLPDIRFQDLRVTLATLLRERKVTNKAISIILGHAHESTTASYYVQDTEVMRQQAGDEIRGIFGGRN